MPETLVGALIGFLVAATVLVKVWTEILSIRKDRLATKATRDRDSQDMHDQILKNTFEITNLKGNQVHHEQILDDLRQQITSLNLNIVELTVTMKEFKEKKVAQ